MKKIILLILSTSLIIGCGEDDNTTEKKKSDLSPSKQDFSSKVIYGEDDRLDLYDVLDPELLRLADSTVALVSKFDIEESNGLARIKSNPFATSLRLPLCSDERFREQNVAAFCTGFLVGKNLVATAGHCINTQGSASSDCSTTRFVFGYDYKSSDKNPDLVASTEVYGCKRIIKSNVANGGADFSIVELDRDVTNHAPLRLRHSGVPDTGTQLVVLGHPSGLPLKVAGGASVRSVTPAFLTANLDTYGGNSGSAVVNAQTLEVEGILVRGEQDFIVKNNCLSSNVCENSGCRGEDATRVSEFLPYIIGQ